MGTLNLDAMTTQFYSAGVHYSAAIQPYAIKLFFALFLIDIIVTWIQYAAEGQLDPVLLSWPHDQACPELAASST